MTVFIYKLSMLLVEVVCTLLYFVSYLYLPITKRIVTKILRESGVTVNGNHSYDPQVRDARFYCYFARYAHVGIVDAYAYGYVECEALNELFYRIEIGKYYRALCFHPSLYLRSLFKTYLFEQSSGDTLTQCSDTYADFSPFDGVMNDDETQAMSTGYWKDAKTLHESFEAKYDLVARKLKLKSGMRVIDIGCGDGHFCKHLASNYNVEVSGYSISKEQLSKAQKVCKGLNVKLQLRDAKKIEGVYDRITCIGVIEHLGWKGIRKFFEAVHRCLTDDGIFLLESYSVNHPFAPTWNGPLERYLDMHGNYTYYLQLSKAIEGLFVVEDWQNIGVHFAKTLNHILQNQPQNEINNPKGGSSKIAYRGYIATCRFQQASIDARHLQLYHIVLSKHGLNGGYETVV